jgi:hypothetical protein
MWLHRLALTVTACAVLGLTAVACGAAGSEAKQPRRDSGGETSTPLLLTEEQAGYAGAQEALALACPTGSGELVEASIGAVGSAPHGLAPTPDLPPEVGEAIARDAPGWSGFDTWVFGETQITFVAHDEARLNGRTFAAGALTIAHYEAESGELFWTVPESGLMYDC